MPVSRKKIDFVCRMLGKGSESELSKPALIEAVCNNFFVIDAISTELYCENRAHKFFAGYPADGLAKMEAERVKRELAAEGKVKRFFRRIMSIRKKGM